MAYAPIGSAAASSLSTATPPNVTPSFDHLVTQWMSQGTASNPSCPNSSQLHSCGLPTMPSMRKLQLEIGTSGVAPAVNTGQPDSAYCPGGSRAASSAGVRRRPKNPREMNAFTSRSLVRSRFVGILARPRPRGALDVRGPIASQIAAGARGYADDPIRGN